MATVNRIVRRYTDINLLLKSHPYSKDVLTRTNADAVKTAIQNLIMTKNYERPFHPEIGSQVNSLIFENFIPSTITALEKSIANTIQKFEPRARIVDIRINDNSEKNAVDIEVTFALSNTEEPVTVTTTINRAR
jgi:phage baseplate assembly protein W